MQQPPQVSHSGERKRPRILFFSPYRLDDIQSGGERRTRLFWDILQAGGYAMETIVHGRPRGRAPMVEPGVHWLPVSHGAQRFYDPRLVRCINATLARFQPDLIWMENFYTGPLIARLAARHGVRLVYNAQNVEAERFAAWSRWHQFGVGLYERDLLKRAGHVVCVSERDRDQFHARYGVAGHRMVVLPNGYDESVFAPATLSSVERASLWQSYGIPDDARILLFPGHQGYAPNVEARHWIVNTLMPRLQTMAPSVHMVLLGPGLPDDIPAARNLHAVGMVQDIAKHLQAADLLLCPLTHGGGSRLKIIEALACGLPVLSTPKGAEGLEAIDETAGLYRAPLEGFVDRLPVLLEALPPRNTTTPPAVAALGRRALTRATHAFIASLV